MGTIYCLFLSLQKDRLRKKNICLLELAVFFLTQPSSKQIICFDFEKQNNVLPNNTLCTMLEMVLTIRVFFLMRWILKLIRFSFRLYIFCFLRHCLRQIDKVDCYFIIFSNLFVGQISLQKSSNLLFFSFIMVEL